MISFGLVTLGLKSDMDPSSNICCEKEGYVTGLLHMVGDDVFPVKAEKHLWDKIVDIDHDGRRPGFYALTVHGNWLSIL
jgi:hypothetical protein